MQTNRQFDIPQWVYALVLVAALAGVFFLPRELTAAVLLLVLAGSMALIVGLVVRRWWDYALPRTALHRALHWSAFGLAIFSGALLAPNWGALFWPLAVMLALIASVLAAPSLMLAPLPPISSPANVRRPRIWHFAAILVSAAVLLGLGLLGTERYGYDVIWPDSHTQYALLWFSIGGLVIGLGMVEQLPPRPRITRTAWGVVALMLVGLMLRVVRLGTHMQYMPDEWIFASAITRFNNHVPITEQVGIYAASTWVFVYWQHALSALVGGGLLGLRLASALIGTLTIAASAWLAHELFDLRPTTHRTVIPISLLTAVILTFFPAHIHYSRLALYNVVDPLVGVVAAALLARAFRTGEMGSYALGGAVLGLTQYFYEAGRLLFIPLFGLWILAALRQNPRESWRGVLITVIAALLIGSLPWFQSIFDNQISLLRLETGSFLYDDDIANPVWFFLTNIGNSILMLTTTPDSHVAPYYGGTQGLIPVMWLPFFIIGGVLLLVRPLRLNHLLPLLWLGGTIAGTALLRDQSTPRFVIALPMLAMLSGLGLNALVAEISQHARLARVALVTVLVSFALAGTVHYFVRHIPSMNEQWKIIVYGVGGYSWEDLAYRMTDVPENNYVVIIADRHSLAVSGRVFREMLNYFNPTVRPLQYRPEDDLEAELWLLAGTDDLTFFVQRGDIETLSMIERYFVLSPPQDSELFPGADVALVRFDVVRRVSDERPELPLDGE